MFKSVDSKPNFINLEHRILDFWRENKVLEKYLHRNDPSKDKESDSLRRKESDSGALEKRFSFFDGPITANNPMGVHHAWGRTLKDLFQRYKNMCGCKQRFQNGFDCQGLWVEVEVEKETGFNSKKDIEKYGVAKFTQACLDRVDKYAKIQTEQSKRLGMFMDWENSYYTNSETNNLYIWHFLKIIHEKGWLYKGRSSATWCPRCETGLSQHEQAEGYKDIIDTSVYVKFPISRQPRQKLRSKAGKLTAGSGQQFFIVWTTTPWTLAANVLLAINTKFDYVTVDQDGEVLYLAKEAADRLGFCDVEEVDPKTLLGLQYESLYDIPAQTGVEHTVVDWDLVDPAEGTGVVHVAPGCGQEDYDLGKELGTAMISPLNEAGHFVEGFDDLSHKFAHDVGGDVIGYLKQEGLLFKTEKVQHRYPHCWRCGTKCLFRLEDDWFINCAELKPQLKKRAQEANWIPEFAGKRMQNWLDNMEDWMISRKRYYGLSLPFYECDCGELTVIGGKEELKELALEPEKVDKLPSLHRPWIDEILIKCPKCGKEVKRIPDVGDCWLDAGVVPFSTLKYFEDKSYWEKWFPAEFICEMVEQVRLWYYSMLVYGTVLEDKVPYLNVLNYMEVRDEKGERMSKTKQNGIPYDEAVGKMGADVMRWMYVKQNPASSLNFGYGPAEEVKRRFFLIFWNCYKFFITYAELDSFDPVKDLGLKPRFRHSESAEGETKNPMGSFSRQCRDQDDKSVEKQRFTFESFNHSILDIWIISKLNVLVRDVTSYLENYQNHKAAQLIEEHVVKDLSTWYIRRSRVRVGPAAVDSEDKLTAHRTLYSQLLILSKLLAPFLPFLAEEMYQNLVVGQGVGLCHDNNREGAAMQVRESVHLTDWPACHDYLIDEDVLEQMKLVREICEKGHAARREAGIRVRQPLRKVTVTAAENVLAHFPVSSSVERSARSGPTENVLAHFSARSERNSERRELKFASTNLIRDELNVKEVEFEKGQELEVKLDIEISPELKLEGLAREMVRSIQNARREAGCNLDDRVIATYPDTAENRSAVEKFEDYICFQTLSQELQRGEEYGVEVA